MSRNEQASVSTQVELGESMQKLGGGEVQHTGVVPFLKKFEATVRCCTQNGVRGGSATTHFPIWHKEINDIIVLKNNKGSEDNRVRKLDYSIQLSELFYKRFLNSEDITLFSLTMYQVFTKHSVQKSLMKCMRSTREHTLYLRQLCQQESCLSTF